MTLLNQITNDFIVKVWNWRPFNAFTKIFFLFLLECQLNKKLLQFLIAEVNAELFDYKLIER